MTKLYRRPQHVAMPPNPARMKNPHKSGWRFPFQGDDLPKESCRCWCIFPPDPGYHPDNVMPEEVWYDAGRQEFGRRHEDVVAYLVQTEKKMYSTIQYDETPVWP